MSGEIFGVALMVLGVCGTIASMFNGYYKDKGKDLKIEALEDHIKILKWDNQNMRRVLLRVRKLANKKPEAKTPTDCERRNKILKKYFPAQTKNKSNVRNKNRGKV